jgi:hypothetical protein
LTEDKLKTTVVQPPKGAARSKLTGESEANDPTEINRYPHSLKGGVNLRHKQIIQKTGSIVGQGTVKVNSCCFTYRKTTTTPPKAWFNRKAKERGN